VCVGESSNRLHRFSELSDDRKDSTESPKGAVHRQAKEKDLAKGRLQRSPVQRGRGNMQSRSTNMVHGLGSVVLMQRVVEEEGVVVERVGVVGPAQDPRSQRIR
jgi:hypothetical protein